MEPSTQVITLPVAVLKRGFWLYVWRVETPKGEFLYVGRTGDNSSPYATAPFTRMGQHLGFSSNQNALRKHLKARDLEAEDCANFQLISHGPLFDEVMGESGADRTALMALHVPIRNMVGALEKVLAEELKAAGYEVLNTVKWKHAHDIDAWNEVKKAFSVYFPRLALVSG
ncbi:hypothetical protein [Rhizobium sp. 21-4511-3d]